MTDWRSALAIALSTGMLAASAFAQNGAARTAPGVSYFSGGVGEEQQQRMQALAQEGYTLKLLFAEQGTGAYVADVHVTVADASGRTVLDALSRGPVFLAKVPDGDYKVMLDYHGARQTRTLHASAKGGQTVVYWPPEGAH